MDKDTLMMQTIDQIILHSKALAILTRKDIPYIQAQAMVAEMMRHYKLDVDDYYDDETFPVEEKSDEQELIDDVNRVRAADMNAVNRSPY